MSDFFFGLTPDRVLSAVEAGGFAPTGHVSPLTCLENRVYDVRLEEGRHVVVKFYRPGRWSRQAILDEHRFLAELHEAEIPVCAPLAFPDGETLHRVEDIQYAVWARTGGRAPDEFDDAELVIGCRNCLDEAPPDYNDRWQAEGFHDGRGAMIYARWIQSFGR